MSAPAPPPPPPLDWRAASLAIGGGVPDDGFLCELLCVFARDAPPRVRAALAAAAAHRRALALAPRDGGAAAALRRRELAARVFVACHALKGSAAGVGLSRVAAAAKEVVEACRALATEGAAADAAAAAAAGADEAKFDALVAPPAERLRLMAKEVGAAAAFIQEAVAGPRGAARGLALGDEARADLAAAAGAAAAFEVMVTSPFRALLAGWAEQETSPAPPVVGPAPPLWPRAPAAAAAREAAPPLETAAAGAATPPVALPATPPLGPAPAPVAPPWPPSPAAQARITKPRRGSCVAT